MERLTIKDDLLGYKKAKPRPFIYDEELVRKLGKLEDFIEEIDNATIIHKDGIATFHINIVLTSDTIEIVKKYFNYKEVKIR